MASDLVIEPEALVDLGMGWASVNEQKGAPVWVIRVDLTNDQPLPVYPGQRTSSDWPGWLR